MILMLHYIRTWRFLMTQAELYDAISLAFYNLSQVNQMLYDYWLFSLYDEEGEIISSQWNERNLKSMEDDVMNQHLAMGVDAWRIGTRGVVDPAAPCYLWFVPWRTSPMLEWIFNNLPVLVLIDCSESKSIEHLVLSPLTGVVIVKMTSGYAYSVPVRRWDMLKIDQYQNPGEWLNTYSLV